MDRHRPRASKLVVSLGKICDGSVHLCKERSKIVDRGKRLKETRLGVGLYKQLKLPQWRRRNHGVGDSKYRQTNHCVISLGLPSLSCFLKCLSNYMLYLIY
jgi:hypothetical protein